MPDGGALLKLAAFDADDLTVISAQLQDAVLKVGDIEHLRRQQKLVMIVKRFDWESAEERRSANFRRRLAGIQFTRVRSVRSRNIRQDSKDGVLLLLAVNFEPAENPAGDIVLTFAGGGVMRLAVECIEIKVEDLGPEWETFRKPAHDEAGTD
jgi:Protein of unknown function (DUF2948)